METTDGYTTRLMVKGEDEIKLLHLDEDFSLSDVRTNDWIVVD